MPNLTDYTVIQDSSVKLPKSNGDIDHDYPKFGAAGLASGRSILLFKVNPEGASELKVTLNNADVLTTAPHGAASHSPTAATRSITPKKTVAACTGVAASSKPESLGDRKPQTIAQW